jgi:DNA polymerase I-like protein with 3'-5' exonuclease and polymerase domains
VRFVTNMGELSDNRIEELISIPKEFIAIDTETVNLENRLILGVAVAISSTEGFYFFNPKDELVGKLIASAKTVVFHNASFDIPALRAIGHMITNYEDSELLAYSNGYLTNNLEYLSRELLGRDCPSVTLQWESTKQGNIGIDHKIMAQFSIIHACNAFGLWLVLPKVDLYYTLDKPCIELVIEMERYGLLIDQYRLTQVEQDIVERTGKLKKELLSELGDINLASNPQVSKALQDKGVLGTRKTKSGADSVSDESLKPLHHPIADKLLSYRSLMKNITTYVPAFRNTDYKGRLHTHFGYTNTGRFRSTKPNLQNITGDKKFENKDLE